MKRLALLFSTVVMATGCAMDPVAQDGLGTDPGSPAKPLVFIDLPAFDRDLSQSLSKAKSPVVVTSAEAVTLKQIPSRLEKWLAAVDSSGGKIETENIDGAEPSTRSIGLILSLLGGLKTLVDYVKENSGYSDARNFNAKIYYRVDAKGERVMDRLEMVRRDSVVKNAVTK